MFSLLGTIYGGDGRTTFGLPDLRGRLPIHHGTGPGVAPRQLGARDGSEQAQVNVGELPVHTHPMQVSSDVSNSANPGSNVTARPTSVDLYIEEPPNTNMSGSAITSVGGGQPHDNVMPFLAVNFIISLVGIFPSRD